MIGETEEEKDRRLVEGYTRIPEDDEFTELAEWSLKCSLEEESWPDENDENAEG